MRRLILVLAFVVGATTLPHLAHTAAAGQASAIVQPDEHVQLFFLQHASAQDVQTRLVQLSGQTTTKLSVSINREHNSVSVRAPEPALKVVEAIIRQLDVPQTDIPGASAPQGARAGGGTAPPAQTPTAQAPAAPPAPARAPSLHIPGVQLVPAATNIKLTLAITDTLTGTPVTKEISVLMLQNSGGMVRTRDYSGASGHMNVDAVALAYQNGAVSVKLTFDYQAAEYAVDGRTRRPPTINESLTLVLQDGKPLTVSETADPGSERRVTVTLTAAILK